VLALWDMHDVSSGTRQCRPDGAVGIWLQRTVQRIDASACLAWISRRWYRQLHRGREEAYEVS
jgi:hypothetical protein